MQPIDLQHQLQGILGLAVECARLADRYPAHADILVALCHEHVTHASKVCQLLSDRLERTPIPAQAYVEEGLGNLPALLAEAKNGALRSRMSASDDLELELLGSIAACLGRHEDVLGYIE